MTDKTDRTDTAHGADVTIEMVRKKINGRFVNYYETDGLIMGFTETGFQRDDLLTLLGSRRLVELKQVHSAILREAGDISDTPGETEGDGIILEEQGALAVIRTADCTPLICWDNDHTIGAVVHIGRQGLLEGIERELIHALKEKQVGLKDLNVYLGPAIEGACYEVGPEIHEAFAAKLYRDQIFIKTPGKEKYLLDVKKGIKLSLQSMGITARQITDPGDCTFCGTQRFPSYRRDNKTGERIYSFLQFKSGISQT